MEVGHLLVRISTDLSGLQKNLDEAKNRFEGLRKAGERVSGIGKTMTAGITLPILGIAAAATHMSMDFNASMANVATLIPGNVQRVNELKTVVQNMAIETGKRTADLSRGLYQVISAFGDTADTAKILEINAKAAAGGLATTEEAIALTSAVTKGYGDTSATAVAKVSDLALLTVRMGQTTFPELAGSIGRVTPIAAAMGVGMEDLFAVMATLTGVTGSAAEVSTQLRGVLQGLMDPSKDMQKALAAMGFESGTLALETLGLEGVLQGLATQTGGNKEALAGLWGQVEAGVAVLALTGGQADTFGQRLQDMRGYAGTTDKAFAEVTSGVNEAGFAWQQMRTQLEVTAQRIGDLLAPTLMQLMDRLKGLISWFESLNDRTKKIIIVIALLAAAIGPLLMIIGQMMMAVAGIMSFFTAIKTAAAAAGLSLKAFIAIKAILLIKILAIIAVVALLAYGVYMLIKNWDKVKEFFLGLWKSVKQAFSAAWEWIKEMFLRYHPVGLLIRHWEVVIEWFRGLPGKIVEFLKQLAADIPYWIGFALGTMVRLIITGITQAVDWFRQLPGRIWTFLVVLATGIHQRFTAIRAQMIEIVSNAINRAVEFFQQLPGRVWTFLLQLPGRILAASIMLSNAMANIATGAVDRFMTFIRNLPGLVWDALMGLRNTILNAASALWRAASSAATSLWNGFKKGLGISSPSYLEEAMERIMTTSKAMLGQMQGDFQQLDRLKVQPQVFYPHMPALAGATPALSAATGVAAYHGPLFTVQNMTVRSDADVEAISRQLHRHIQAGIRAKGGR